MLDSPVKPPRLPAWATRPPLRATSAAGVERRWGLLLASPAALYFAIFWVLPLGLAAYYSFTAYDLVQSPRWIGLQNYSALGHDPDFKNSLVVTGLFTAGFVIPTVVLALIVATPLSRPGRWHSLLRALFFIPAVMPLVASAALWQLIYANQGLANAILQALGLGPVNWLTSPGVALWSLVAMVVWKYFGLYVLILTAGLQSVPASVYDAAALDGSRTLRTFFHITLPLIRRPLLFVVVIALIGAAQSFVPAYILTNGGPADATNVLPLYIFQNAFSYTSMGYASAIAMVLLAILIILSLIQFRLFRSED
jgi:multiple sugar transport system permease protein